MGGISEIVSLTSLKVKLNTDAFPLHPITKKVSLALGFDPLYLISSGVLLAVLSPDKVEIAEERLRKAGICCSVVGSFEYEGLGAQDFMAKEELWRMLSL